MFRRLGAGSGALWRPWYDGGRHGDRALARLRCVVVFCVSIVRKLLPRGKTAREQFLPSVAWLYLSNASPFFLKILCLIGQFVSFVDLHSNVLRQVEGNNYLTWTVMLEH